MEKILKVLEAYIKQGRFMRFCGRFDGCERGVILVLEWGSVHAVFIPWARFRELAVSGALKLERMSPAAGGGLHLRPNKKPLKMWLAAHQSELEMVNLQLDRKEYLASYEEWRAGRPKAVWNLGWFAEAALREALDLAGEDFVRNKRTKGQSDIVLTTPDGKSQHWEVKDLIGAGFQIRPEQAAELGLDD